MTGIDTGDTVHHTPTGEKWIVAYVRGDRLAWCGWPEGEAALSDCTLVKKETPERRDKLLREMAENTDGARGRYARAVLSPGSGASNVLSRAKPRAAPVTVRRSPEKPQRSKHERRIRSADR